MEKKKVEYVPAIGRESTNLFMMFSPKDSTCFLTDELVLKINKMKEKTFIQKSTTALNTHTEIRANFLPLFKINLQRSTTSPDYCQNISHNQELENLHTSLI